MRHLWMPSLFLYIFLRDPKPIQKYFCAWFHCVTHSQWCEMYDFSPVKYTVISLKSKALNTIDFGTPKCLPKNRNVGRK